MKSFIAYFLRMIFRVVYKIAHSSSVLKGVWYDSIPSNSLVISSHEEVSYIVNTYDKVIGKSIYKSGGYDSDKLTKALKITPGNSERDILVDVGANIGSISIEAITKGLFKRAIMIEPEPKNFRLLKTNVVLNAIEDYVLFHNCAVGNEDNKTLTFELSDRNSGDNRVKVSDYNGKDGESNRVCLEVPSMKLDTLVGEIDPNSLMVWVDTQGFEAFVLEGASNLIRQRVPFVIEFWPYGLERTKSFSKLIEVINEFEYYIDLGAEISEKIPVTNENIINLAKTLGTSGKFTDLLLLN